MTNEKELFISILSIVLVIFISIMLYFASIDNNALTTKTYLYIITALLPLLCVFVYTVRKNNNFNSFYLLIIAFIIAIIYYFYSTLDAISLLLINYTLSFLYICIVLVGLAMFYNTFTNYLLKINGYPGFFILLLFCVPCFINDCIKYIFNELKITPKISYILLLLEIFLILCYFLIPKINIKTDGIKILENNHFLDTKKIIKISNITNITDTDTIVKNYSISLWIYINTPEISSTVFPLFCYGNTNQPKPMITYRYEEKEKQHLYTIYFSTKNDNDNDNDNDSSSIKLNLPNQKWHNFVFNYNTVNVNLFINGILERTMNIANNMPIYNIDDNIVIGSKNIGISGSISTITYYNKILSSFEILGMYRLGINTGQIKI